jgi:hypothetical protein
MLWRRKKPGPSTIISNARPTSKITVPVIGQPRFFFVRPNSDLLVGRCQVVLKKDVPLVFGCHKPIAEQGIMMSNNLRGREQLPIPGAMPILDQGDIILQATGLPARRIDAQFGSSSLYRK